MLCGGWQYVQVSPLHFYSGEGKRGLSVQPWTLIPYCRRKAGFPLRGLVLIPSCFYTGLQSTQLLHFTTTNKPEMSHHAKFRSSGSQRCQVFSPAPSVCSHLNIPHPSFSSASSIPVSLPSPSSPFFKALLLPVPLSYFWVLSTEEKLTT